jgi:hypothetical protein
MLTWPPILSPRVVGVVVAGHGHLAGDNGAGVQASRTGCEGLTGLAKQMCYSTLHGV